MKRLHQINMKDTYWVSLDKYIQIIPFYWSSRGEDVPPASKFKSSNFSYIYHGFGEANSLIFGEIGSVFLKPCFEISLLHRHAALIG